MVSSEQLRQPTIDMLAACDTKYHLTIDFPYLTQPKVTQNVLNDFLGLLNKDIYKKRFERGESYLEGFCIRERTHGMNTVHYHILISDEAHIWEHDRFQNLIDNKVTFIKKKHAGNHITKHYLQNYHNDGDNQLEKYLTKQFEKISSGDIALNNIGILGPDKLDFDLFEQHNSK